MLENILPVEISNVLNNKINLKLLNEIRIRANKPITLFMGGQAYFLSESGLASALDEAIIATKTMVEDIVFRASECSIYSVNEQIKKGYLVMKGGVRLGLSGSIISDENRVSTISNFTSINIRIPHEIRNCCLNAFEYMISEDKLKSTLVISPPGAGKTTFIRDFIYQLSIRNYCFNVLVLDERGEIDLGTNGSLGNFSDVLSFSTKKQGFENGIRALSPHLIVTDELGGEEDAAAISYAVNSGVKILATVHGSKIEDILKKEALSRLIKDKVFERYVVLSSANGPGTYEGIYNENFSRLTRWN